MNANREFINRLASLSHRGIEFDVQEPIKEENGCHISHPVQLLGISSGYSTIALPAKPILNCRFALRLATWLSDVSAPVVKSFTTSPLKAVTTGPGYVCRNRNNNNSAKISEHAFGNAIDITGFQVAKRKSVLVSDLLGGPAQRVRMLTALRISSCGYFTTVLGPGSNSAHKSHFHLDYAKHGRSWNYRICE